MKYVYVITRFVRNVPNGVVVPPTLGVFTNVKKAHGHFDVVVNDRRFRGCSHGPERSDLNGIPVKLREVEIRHPDSMIEILRLEKWRA